MNKIRKLIRHIIVNVIKLFSKPSKEGILLIDETPFSGSNVYALYLYIINEAGYSKVNIENGYATKKIKSLKDLLSFINYQKKLFQYPIIITDHGFPELLKSQTLIQLWHGIPMKNIGLMDSYEDTKGLQCFNSRIDYFISSSKISICLLNACFGIDGEKYKILGSPRNDWLFTSAKSIINIFIPGFNDPTKVILFMPTYKSGYRGRIDGESKNSNFFSFRNFDIKEFDQFLEINSIVFILKLHPFEEQEYYNIMKDIAVKNIHVLHSAELTKEKIDITQVLAVTDILITDYSSVYIDYLLTLKPIIFCNADFSEYKKSRGFLLEPYDYWTPGPKVTTQNELQKEILYSLENNDYYFSERKLLQNIFHDYKDNHNCERLWEFITNELQQSTG